MPNQQDLESSLLPPDLELQKGEPLGELLTVKEVKKLPAQVVNRKRDQILEYRGSQERTPWPRRESRSPPCLTDNTYPTSSNQELLDLLREAKELGLSPPSHVQESSISPSPPSLSSFSTSSGSSPTQPLPRNAFSSKHTSPDTRPPILAPTTALSIISSPVFAAAFDKIIRRAERTEPAGSTIVGNPSQAKTADLTRIARCTYGLVSR